MLGIHNDILPQDIRERIADMDTEMWGDFKVCPFTREQPRHMQFVYSIPAHISVRCGKDAGGLCWRHLPLHAALPRC